MSSHGGAFRCRECSAPVAKWVGRCPVCGLEQPRRSARRHPAPGRPGVRHGGRPSPHRRRPRRRGRGGADRPGRARPGAVGRPRSGSVTLLGGEPGIGKSTLLLQVVGAMAARGAPPRSTVATEESAAQVRAPRRPPGRRGWRTGLGGRHRGGRGPRSSSTWPTAPGTCSSSTRCRPCGSGIAGPDRRARSSRYTTPRIAWPRRPAAPGWPRSSSATSPRTGRSPGPASSSTSSTRSCPSRVTATTRCASSGGEAPLRSHAGARAARDRDRRRPGDGARRGGALPGRPALRRAGLGRAAGGRGASTVAGRGAGARQPDLGRCASPLGGGPRRWSGGVAAGGAREAARGPPDDRRRVHARGRRRSPDRACSRPGRRAGGRQLVHRRRTRPLGRGLRRGGSGGRGPAGPAPAAPTGRGGPASGSAPPSCRRRPPSISQAWRSSGCAAWARRSRRPAWRIAPSRPHDGRRRDGEGVTAPDHDKARAARSRCSSGSARSTATWSRRGPTATPAGSPLTSRPCPSTSTTSASARCR